MARAQSRFRPYPTHIVVRQAITLASSGHDTPPRAAFRESRVLVIPRELPVLSAAYVDSLFEPDAADGHAARTAADVPAPPLPIGVPAPPPLPIDTPMVGPHSIGLAPPTGKLHGTRSLPPPDVLRAAQVEVQGRQDSRAGFAKKNRISPRQLRMYVDPNGGLTDAGLKAMSRSPDDTPTRIITPQLLRTAVDEVGHGRREMTRSMFARTYNVDLSELKKYVQADGALTPLGLAAMPGGQAADELPDVAAAAMDAALQVPRPGCSDAARARYVDAMAAQLATENFWDFAGADDALAMTFTGLGFYYHMRIALDRGPGPTWYGPAQAAEAGTILVRNGAYAVKLAGHGYAHRLPRDGDRAFHAINAVQLHARGNGEVFKHYREDGPTEDNGYAARLTPSSPGARTSARLIRHIVAALYRQAMQKIR